MAQLEAAAAECQDCVWTLARRGFVCVEDDIPQYVHGIADHDVAERVVVQLLADLLSPDSRKAIAAGDLQASALRRAHQDLRAVAVRGGRVTSLRTAQDQALLPPAVDDLDRMIAEDTRPGPAEVPRDADDEVWRAQAGQLCTETVEAMDERSRTLVRMRFVEGKPPEDVAAHFTCGVAAVLAHEARLRRALSRALKKSMPTRPCGPATQDALLSESVFDAVPPPITRARIRRDVLRRTFIDEPAPFGARLAWGLAASALAATAWALMFFGVLPHPDDDPLPEPAVQARCDGPCGPGQAVSLDVLAPQDAARVGFFVASGDAAQPLLVAPAGGPIRLPLGARTKLVPVPYTAKWPEGATGDVVAVFAEGPVDAKVLADVAAGRVSAPGVSVTRARSR